MENFQDKQNDHLSFLNKFISDIKSNLDYYDKDGNLCIDHDLLEYESIPKTFMEDLQQGFDKISDDFENAIKANEELESNLQSAQTQIEDSLNVLSKFEDEYISNDETVLKEEKTESNLENENSDTKLQDELNSEENLVELTGETDIEQINQEETSVINTEEPLVDIVENESQSVDKVQETSNSDLTADLLVLNGVPTSEKTDEINRVVETELKAVDNSVDNVDNSVESKMLKEVLHLETTQNNKKAKLSTKKIGVIAAALVALTVLSIFAFSVLGSANNGKGVFANDDPIVTGLFVEGELVLASSDQSNIQTAIDEFQNPYKTLEETQVITGLDFSTDYEIRELSQEEIDNKINTEFGVMVENLESEDAVQGEVINKTGEKVVVCDSVSQIKNVLFYGSNQTVYEVAQGDNLSKIANDNDMTLTDIMVSNPELLEDQVVMEGQEIEIAPLEGVLTLSFSRNIIINEDLEYKKVEEKSSSLYVGEKSIKTPGQNGVRQEIIRYQYVDNKIHTTDVISDTVIAEPVDEVTLVGTKAKPSGSSSSSSSSSSSGSSSSSSSISGNGSLRWPASGRVTSEFGPRSAPTAGASSYHKGIDIAAASGTPIYAAASGVVTYSGYSGGYGYWVEIRHNNGVVTRYAHNSSNLVKVGQSVSSGQQIAKMGSTGVSTGSHVHFEVIVNGAAVNPRKYL